MRFCKIEILKGSSECYMKPSESLENSALKLSNKVNSLVRR